MSKTKKIAKKFKDKKQLEKYVKDIDFNYVTFYVQHKEKIQDLPWSQKYKDDQIRCFKNQAATSDGRGGAVALDKKLVQKTSWRLMIHGASRGFQMGIAVIPENKSQGSMYNFNSHKSGLGQGYYLLNRGQAYSDYYEQDNKITNFQMESQEWITLTYDPDANILNFFNEDTGNSYKLKIKPKEDDVNYYPVVLLYKATAYQFYYDPDDDLPDDYYGQQQSQADQQRMRTKFNEMRKGLIQKWLKDHPKTSPVDRKLYTTGLSFPTEVQEVLLVHFPNIQNWPPTPHKRQQLNEPPHGHLGVQSLPSQTRKT